MSVESSRLLGEYIFCTLCVHLPSRPSYGRFFESVRAQRHVLFAHRLKLPLWLLYWKGILVDCDFDSESFPPPSQVALKSARGGVDISL